MDNEKTQETAENTEKKEKTAFELFLEMVKEDPNIDFGYGL
jgi:hypothetical protein